MNPANPLPRAAWLLTGSLAVLSLVACNKTPATAQAPEMTRTTTVAASYALPVDPNAPAMAPAYAPAASALAEAPPAQVDLPQSSEARYCYVARADQINSGFADSPPDYAIDYQGTRPWYWRAQTGAYRVVEATPDGDRYYYYESGADQPFLVRDLNYAYGYHNGRLAVVYDAFGRALANDVAARQAYLAGRYLARARALRDADQRERHQGAYATYWQARQNELARQQQEWAAQRQKNADWQAWQDQNAAKVNANAWRQEADARRAQQTDLAQARARQVNLTHIQQRQGQQAAQAQAQQQQAPAEVARRAAVQQAAQALVQARQAQAQQKQAQAEAARRAAQAEVQARQAQAQQQRAQAETARRAAAQQSAQIQVQARQAQAQQQQGQAEAARRAAAQQAAQAQVQALQAQAQQQRAQTEAARRESAQQAAQAKVQAAKPDKTQKDKPDQSTTPPK